MREYLCVRVCAALGGGFSLCSRGIKTTAINRAVTLFPSSHIVRGTYGSLTKSTFYTMFDLEILCSAAPN